MDARRHFYLYAKNHYKRTSVLADLRQIGIFNTGLEPRQLADGDIRYIMVGLAERHLRSGEFKLRDFVAMLEDDHFLSGEACENITHRVINACHCVLQMAKVGDSEAPLCNIGEADPAVLPLS